MVMSMDVTRDQTISSSPPIDLSEPGALAQSSSLFQNQASFEGDKHEEDNSKCSGQAIVTMQQRQQQQQPPNQRQQRELASCRDTTDSACSDQQEQRMVVSGGSSFEEEDKRLMMSIDGEEETDRDLEAGGTDSTSMRANLRLEQAELEARLTQAKSTKFGAGIGQAAEQPPVESSLVAQMRDIVEGGHGGNSNRRTTTTTMGEAESRQNVKSGEQQPETQIKSQPKSSSDSLNNQNENGHSRASIDSAGQKQSRHLRAHCRHHHNHHQHHHHHHHRHRQSVSGGSLPGHVEIGTTGGELASGTGKPASGAQSHSHPHRHHHHHGHGPHRHTNSSPHPHHHHHHHQHHHHHPHDHKRGVHASKRNSIQRLSLAMIEPTGPTRTAADGGEEPQGTSGPADQKMMESNNSSMTSVSSVAPTTSRRGQQQPQQHNPNQSNPESKSSESPPSDEPSAVGGQGGAEVSSSGQQQQQQDPSDPAERELSNKATQQGHGHHQHAHHHHHHHHHSCHHRSHKKRLVLDAGNNQPEAVAKSDIQSQAAAGALNDSRRSCESGAMTRRRPLQDLASGANVSAGGGELASNDDEKTTTMVAREHTHHAHHHHHHQSHLHHRHHHHHHNVHCATHKQQARSGGESGVAELHSLADEPTGAQHTTTTALTSGFQTEAPHHHHCVHRHHGHHRHHHHHHNNHAHHHCRQQRGHVHRNKQKSVSQTNVDQVSSTRDSNRTLDKSDETEVGAEALLTKDGHPDAAQSEGPPAEGFSVTAANDEVVKMETSPSSPLGRSEQRRQSMQADNKPSVEPSTGQDGQSEQPVDGLGSKDSMQQQQQQHEQRQQQAADAELGDAGEAGHKSAQKPACELNREAQYAAANQENFRSDAADEEAASNQQQANKLTRQMSSQSSRRSQREYGTRGSPGDLDGDQNQSEHLRECAERALQPAAINQRPDETRQVIESSAPSDRRCRLCWCCCCPCSALSARDGSNRAIEKPKASQGAPNSPVGTNYPSLPNVPLDEIRSWGESFDKLMKCSDGRKVFQDFLRCEYSEENILFWAACEELKKEKDSKNIASKARDIYEDYISILSSKEVSLDSRVRDIINNNIKKPTSNIFDEAQLQIYTLMHRDSYPRFINSIMYKKLAQIPVSNSRKSSS